MKIVATIEARMTSSRLPGKVLLPALNKPLLEHLVNRLKSVKSINEIILATTINETDNVLIDFTKSADISYFRGSEDDVMRRVIEAAEFVKADVVVEITGDCPIIDPNLIEQTIQIFLNNECDYASNCNIRSYPDGMDTQVFWLETLKKSAAMTIDPLDHEHVTVHIRKHPELFKLVNIVAPPNEYWPDLGLTLDEILDYELIKKIIEHFGETNSLFSCLDIINFLKGNPKIRSINDQVKRKRET